jgi:L-asparaginase II
MDSAVEVWRGGRVESRHRVAVCVVDAAGTLRAALGDVDRPIYPRSAIKPFQAVPLVETGAADRLGFSEAELALACASHSGRPEHTERVAALLQRLGLSEADLGCGPHEPIDREAACALCRAGTPPGRLHNNCSGKHAGMLALARDLGAPTAGYLEPRHAVQRHVLASVGAFCGVDAQDRPGIDGCSAPAPAMPLHALARGAARLADPDALGPARRDAVLRILRAMRAHPELVAGPCRADHDVMRAVPEVITKTGAEGVFLLAVPQKRLGVAIKALDGADRAAETALLAVLDALGLLAPIDRTPLQHRLEPAICDRNGTPVGRIAPAPAWREALDRALRSLR